MRKISSIFILLLIIHCLPGYSQQDFKISFRIKGLKDTTCLIANYYGNGTYIKDTVRVNTSGRCIYKAQSDLPRGLYIFVISEKLHFDFIINNDNRFLLETDLHDLTGKMAVSGSPENSLFYQYLSYNKAKYDEIMTLQNRTRMGSDPADSIKNQKKIDSINQEIINYKLDLIKKHPSSFLGFMLKAMKEPDINKAPHLPDGGQDPATAYAYFRQHFWDDTDLSDDRLLRTPVFHNKLQKYLDKVVIQNPDTLIREIDRLITRAQSSSEMFKYLVWYSTYHYENSEIMGFDKIFVHIVDKYYITGRTPWIDVTTLENIIKKANRTRPLLLGQKAPNMIMLDTGNRLVSMHNIESKFLILLFWDPDCGHCEQEIPKIKDFYEQYREVYGLNVLAICSDTSLTKWKSQIKKKKMNWINVDGPRTLTGDYHEQYNISLTPVIYILNDKKEIIAKNLRADQLQIFMKNYIELSTKK